jgi:phage baseplate assembly protein W
MDKDLTLNNFTAVKQANGNLRKITGVNVIQKSIENILKTPIGSIPNIPEFGSHLFSYLPQALDDILVETAERQLKIDIERWEDRADELTISVKLDRSNKILIVDIGISYRNQDADVSLDRTNLDLGNQLNELTPEEKINSSSIFDINNIVGFRKIDRELVEIY